MSDLPLYTRSEVSSKSNLIIVSNKVYDIQTYATDHPGGEELLLRYSGQDATRAFYGLELQQPAPAGENVDGSTNVSEEEKQQLHAHSSSAWRILDGLCVGEVLMEERRSDPEGTMMRKSVWKQRESKKKKEEDEYRKKKEKGGGLMDMERFCLGEGTIDDLGLNTEELARMALADEGAAAGPPPREGGVVGVERKNPPVEGYYRGEASLDDLGVDLDDLASGKHDGTIRSKGESEHVLDVMVDTKPDDERAKSKKKKKGLLDNMKERVAKNRREGKKTKVKSGSKFSSMMVEYDEEEVKTDDTIRRRDADKKTKNKKNANKSSILGSMMVEYNSDGGEVENRRRRMAETNEEELERRYNLSLSELDSNASGADFAQDVVSGAASAMKDDVKVDKAASTSHQFIVTGSSHNLDDEEFVYGVNNIHSGLVTALGGVSKSSRVDLVAKILLSTRLFPELTGTFRIVNDVLQTERGGEEDSTAAAADEEEASFRLDGGWLRRVLVSDDGKGEEVLESRIIDPLELTDCVREEEEKEGHEHQLLRCCGWTLRPIRTADADDSSSPDVNNHEGPSWIRPPYHTISEWESAILASGSVRDSKLYREDAQRSLSLLAGAMASSLDVKSNLCPDDGRMYDMSVTGVEVLEYLEDRLGLLSTMDETEKGSKLVVELANALLDGCFLRHVKDQRRFRVTEKKEDSTAAGVAGASGKKALFLFSDDVMALCAIDMGRPAPRKTSQPNESKSGTTNETIATQRGTSESVYLNALRTEGTLLNQFERWSQTEEYHDQVLLQGMASGSNASRLPLTFHAKLNLRRSFDRRHLVLDDTNSPPSSPDHHAQSPTKVSHAYPCDYTNQVVPYTHEVWPQAPLLLRPTPKSGMKILGIRLSSSDKYMFLPGSGFCCGCTLPINTGRETPGKSLVTDFETDSFKGTLLIRIRGCRDAQAGLHDANDSSPSSAKKTSYFDGRLSQSFHIIVRGQFKNTWDDGQWGPIPISDCVTGQLFDDRPTGKMIPRFVLRSALNVITMLSPNLEVKWTTTEEEEKGRGGKRHRMSFLSPLASTAQSIVVSEPKQIVGDAGDLAMEESSLTEPSDQSPTSLLSSLVDKFKPTPTHSSSTHSGVRRKVRKSAFDHSTLHYNNSSEAKDDDDIIDDEPIFVPNREYTFTFHSNIVDLKELTLDMGYLGKHDISTMLNGQPLKIMAARRRRRRRGGGGVGGDNQNDGNDEDELDWLWSFDLWHSKLFSTAKMHEGD